MDVYTSRKSLSFPSSGQTWMFTYTSRKSLSFPSSGQTWMFTLPENPYLSRVGCSRIREDYTPTTVSKLEIISRVGRIKLLSTHLLIGTRKWGSKISQWLSDQTRHPKCYNSKKIDYAICIQYIKLSHISGTFIVCTYIYPLAWKRVWGEHSRAAGIITHWFISPGSQLY